MQQGSPADLSRDLAQRTRKRVAASKRRAAVGVTMGRLIAAERVRQGLSQHQLARAVDCPDDMIGHFENGRSNYWAKLREIIQFLAPRAGKVWLTQCTKILMGRVDEMVWEEPDPVKRLMLAEWLRSSGDRATASSPGVQQAALPGFPAELTEPQFRSQRIA